MRIAVIAFLSLTFTFAPGCDSAEPTDGEQGDSGGKADDPDAEPDQEVEHMPHALHWLRNSAEYRAAVATAYAAAGTRLEFLHSTGELPAYDWAVALDADETVIDNSQYAKERVEIGQGFTPQSWSAWTRRKEAKPLPGAIAFIELVHELGGRVAIVTNRTEKQCPDTGANFEAEGIPFDVMLCKGDDRQKEPRWQMVEDGTASEDLPALDIVMWLGDNIQDFPDLDQELRHEAEDALSEFGRTYYVIPNPTYGSWESNPKL